VARTRVCELPIVAVICAVLVLARRDLHFGRACVVGFVRAFGFGIAVGDRDRVAAFGEGVGGLLGVIRRDRRPAFVEIFTPDAEREIFAVGFCRSAGRALNRGHRRSGINRGVGLAGDADVPQPSPAGVSFFSEHPPAMTAADASR